MPQKHLLHNLPVHFDIRACTRDHPVLFLKQWAVTYQGILPERQCSGAGGDVSFVSTSELKKFTTRTYACLTHQMRNE